MRTSFEITRKEIEAAYSNQNKAQRIYFEYVSKYRRIVVLEHGRGFEISVTYKGFAKEYNKPYSTYWGELPDAIGWAKAYVENRNIICGNLTIIEACGVQKI
jgi:hypothetical protein